jgi:hypothetical protein
MSEERGFELDDIKFSNKLANQAYFAKEDRKKLAANLRKSNISRKDLKAKATSMTPDERDRQQKVSHTRAASDTSIKQAEHRARATSNALQDSMDFARSNPVQTPPSMVEQEGLNLNLRHRAMMSRNMRWGSEADLHRWVSEDAPDHEEHEAQSGRGRGAILPPPHPRSLSERAKSSPKAARDSARASALEGMKKASKGSLAGKAMGAVGRLGGKLGGKLGMYGAIKGAIEGADTLRKLKSGAYDLTPEGTAKLKKGYEES